MFWFKIKVSLLMCLIQGKIQEKATSATQISKSDGRLGYYEIVSCICLTHFLKENSKTNHWNKNKDKTRKTVITIVTLLIEFTAKK